MLEVQNQIGLEKNLEYKDKIQTVLVEDVSDTDPTILTGRNDGGKLVTFAGDASLKGKYVKVKITKPKQWSLEGELQ